MNEPMPRQCSRDTVLLVSPMREVVNSRSCPRGHPHGCGVFHLLADGPRRP